MKLKIVFTKNTTPVPLTYIDNLKGYLHKVIGANNKYHDDISLYSTSTLHGSVIASDKQSYDFAKGAIWYVSSYDYEFITKFVTNIYENTYFAFGMELKSVEFIETKPFNNSGTYYFRIKSPIILRKASSKKGSKEYFTCNHDNSITSKMMNNIILKKAKKANLTFNANDFDISFDSNYSGKQTRWTKINNIGNFTSICPIIIKTKNMEILNFIYSVGIGDSTGCGFGFIL